MKRIRKSAIMPQKLANFVKQRPAANWEQFRDKPGRYKELAQYLRLDQHNLCAYCEIDLLESNDTKTLDDFRVEHFHPKSPHQPPPNWALDWGNLLACCHGGSQQDVADPERFTAPDFCCDVPKDDFDWTAEILNPLIDIPAFPCLFKYDEANGAMALDKETCPTELHAKAQTSIDWLCLNAPRLLRMREGVLMGLNDQITMLLENGDTPAMAAATVAQAVFADPWPRFFTAVRWYLGRAAEEQLQRMGYEG